MTDIPKLRADYMAVAAFLVDCGEWTAEQADEIGLAIKEAMDQQDHGYLAWWAEWLANMARMVAHLTAWEAEVKRRAIEDSRKARGLNVGAK